MRRITRVGGVEEVEVNVRVICATHRDLEAECRRNMFRSDLYFRISAFTIVVPPLRDRPMEIEQHGRQPPALSQGALDALRRYTWPGGISRRTLIYRMVKYRLKPLPPATRELPG